VVKLPLRLLRWFSACFLCSPWLGTSLVLLLGLHLVYGIAAFPNPDEAYYWLWGQWPDWSYYDHPPLHAWIQGAFTTGLGKSRWVMRLPTLLSNGLLFYTYYQIIAYLNRAGSAPSQGWQGANPAERQFRILVSGIWASPLYFVFLTLAWPDQWLIALALLCSYLWIRFWDAYIDGAANPGYWRLYLAGFCLGLAMLCKYTAVFVGITGFGVVVRCGALRSLLRNAHWWGGIAIATLTLTPIIIWNAQHDWLSFQYYLTRSVDSGASAAGLALKPLQVISFWLTSILILSPFLSWELGKVLLPQRRANSQVMSTTYRPMAVGLFTLSTVSLSLVGLFSTALYYWNILAYLLLIPLVSQTWASGPTLKRSFRWHQSFGLLAAGLLVLNYCGLPLSVFFGPEGDPDGRMLFGWHTVAPIVQAHIQPQTQLLTTDYRSAAALAFALNNREVLAISQRQDQFDIWAKKTRPLAPAHSPILLLADDWHPLTPEIRSQLPALQPPIIISIYRWGLWIKNYFLYSS
jgi:4-amino-4-deoxy-L-arabinose transferase-like glycosyltransferase